ncbi:AAA domain-containing protein, putative AbiEii toxin, Type IV TA system [Pedobacter westerhofensis]|uniref:AAA domain-containing protein, putative AbiEii toxin, Type IV TA system n=1 Tax=Pedobacter westerhofensis TaxID=425512 RepID=A0A521FT88_9SPHI|nr:AAA family ATPase [Pedobacter westerhofensis]SMO99423.1 AAA domain-containing protein, putative AbiEii toxin, Type IV TA system [Pedobacter westerhofensis]
MNTIGSQWRKWDMHIHTPETNLSNNYMASDTEDVWEVYCKKIEESDVSVFGITDYFSSENYFKFIEKHKIYYPSSNKVFFPNIEFRLEVSVNKTAEEVNIHVIFSPEVSKDKIDEFLLKLDTNINVEGTTQSCRHLESKNDFEKAAVSHVNIVNTLKKVFGRNKCYLLIGAANNAGLRPDSKSPRKLTITDEIDKLCDGFFGGEQNVDYYLDTERYETQEKAKKKPVLTGCDAHSFEDCDNFLGKKAIILGDGKKSDEVIKNVTWLKADTTFEGFKQILFEPSDRVRISELRPREPIRKIESIKFNFQPNTVIKKAGTATSGQPFCLLKLKNEIKFSPFFTCIIGGRGTGKSTIINILAERLGLKTDFFNKDNNLLTTGSNNVKFNNDEIEIIGTEEIEFVSQGKVERLAEGDELTSLVYNERIRETENGFFELEASFTDQIEKNDELIKHLFEIDNLQSELKESEKELLNNQKIVDSEKDPRYTAITQNINTLGSEMLAIESSKNRYSTLLGFVKNIITQTVTSKDSNEYEARIREILNILKDFEEITETELEIVTESKVFKETDSTYERLTTELQAENQLLKEFFLEKGTSEESIKDSQNASENIARLTQEIEEESQKIANVKLKIAEIDDLADEIRKNSEDTTALISSCLDALNEKLTTNNENVKEIKFTFEFNRASYRAGLFEEFYRIFSKYHLPSTQVDKVTEVLYLIEPDESLLAMSFEDFKKEIDQQLTKKGYNRNTNYLTIFNNIFETKINFLVYQILIKKHLFNISKYIKINGFYGERELNACSFGQRCTAVIVTLLMTGVKPLIVDEPEAHLDNRLIADYLVQLIKSKKFDRQIIFATHNSNFVVNGDAELTHILEIPDNGIYTSISTTTIENLNHRTKLLKLEGGEEAFINREKKYGIKN